MTRNCAIVKFKQKAWIFPGLLVLCLLAGASSASAEDMKSRVNRLENEIQTLSRAVFKGEAPPPGSFGGNPADAADTEVRLQQLETQIRALTGKIEEQSFQVNQLQEQLQRMATDNETRFNDMQGAGVSSGGVRYTATPPQAQVQPYSGDAAGGVAPPQPQAQDGSYTWTSRPGEATLGTITNNPATGDQGAVAYENAFAMLKGGQYMDAEKGFEGFLASNPGHSLTGNAKYWLGESYYARGEYEKASRTFAGAYQDNPKGPKAPDNLLKLGMSLASQGKKDDACIALGQVEKEFSTGAGPVLRRAQEEMTKVGC